MNRLIIAILITLSFSSQVAAKTYKWVDNKGVTHMGDTIPAEYANKDRSVLNKSGRTVDTQDVLTPEERRARDAEDARIKAEQDIARNRKIHDSSLLNTYSNVKEIDQARARNVQQIDARAQVTSKQLDEASKSLANLKAKAAEFSKAGKPLPAFLQDDLDAAQASVAKLSKDMTGINTEKSALESRYEADKIRYQELTGK